jgi:hypothetical protein
MRALLAPTAADLIQMGNMGAAEVESADAFVLIAPQNIIGHSIMPLLSGAQGQAGRQLCSAGGEGSGRLEGWSQWVYPLSFLPVPQPLLPHLPTHACCPCLLRTLIGCLAAAEMITAAEAERKPLVLINPKLTDIQSGVNHVCMCACLCRCVQPQSGRQAGCC